MEIKQLIELRSYQQETLNFINNQLLAHDEPSCIHLTGQANFFFAFKPIEQVLEENRLKKYPQSCQGCYYLHGEEIVCALHPKGLENCADYEE